MLRYLKAVQQMKSIIKDNNLTVMATTARYICAYEKIAKPDWWNKSKTDGPIVEQGTHFCDLSRYFGGDVQLERVMANSLEWYEGAGKLSKLAIDESKVPEEERIPRVTSATWWVAVCPFLFMGLLLILFDQEIREWGGGYIDARRWTSRNKLRMRARSLL